MKFVMGLIIEDFYAFQISENLTLLKERNLHFKKISF